MSSAIEGHGPQLVHTTLSESLRAGRETLSARHWALWNGRGARGTLRKTNVLVL
jgi:hypothetical protein